jgi:NifB/MoaA-like Fe-S oxidoreductase
MVRRFLDEWHEVRREIKAWQEEESAENQAKIPALESITLVTATLFEQTLESVANEFSALTETATHVATITNQRLGDTITVAGLLMVQDIIDQLLASNYGDLIILPQVTFDHPDVISLDDLSPQTVANRLGVPVVLGDQMGDVWDAWLGQSRLIFLPQ